MDQPPPWKNTMTGYDPGGTGATTSARSCQAATSLSSTLSATFLTGGGHAFISVRLERMKSLALIPGGGS